MWKHSSNRKMQQMNPSALETRACLLGDTCFSHITACPQSCRSISLVCAGPAISLLHHVAEPGTQKELSLLTFFFQWKTDRLTSADSTEDCVSLKEEFTGQMHSVLIDRGKGMTRFNTSKRRQVAWGLYTYKWCFALYWLSAQKSIPWGTEGKADHFFLVCSAFLWDKLSPCCSNSGCPQMLAAPLKWNAVSQLTPSRLKMITVAFTKEAMMTGKKMFLKFLSNPQLLKIDIVFLSFRFHDEID